MGDYEFLKDKYNNVENTYYKEVIWNKVDLVKVAHHGSTSALIEGFYKSTLPEYAVISAGTSSSQNNPDEKVLQAIETESHLTKIFITKRDETIMIESDGITVFYPEFINKKFDGNM